MTTLLTVLRASSGATAIDPLGAALVLDASDEAVSPPDVPAAEQETLGRQPADPLRQWKAVTAVLEVHPDGGNHFRVRGAHPDHELPTVGGHRYGRPSLALGRLVAPGGAVPTDVQWKMREWSRSHDEITQWVDELRAAVGDDNLRLVIWDDTGFEVPWELLWLPGSAVNALPGGWLGALVPVTRWTTLHKPFVDASPYTDSAYTCRGDFVAYLIEAMAADLAVLQRFGAVTTVDESTLLQRLASLQPPLGLVYVASHGQPQADTVHNRLGGLRLASLSFDPLHGLQACRSLVFLNACHSGRLFADPDLNDSLLRGFAQAFLTQGAPAVIGTVGEVETGRAREVARELLEALTGPGHPHLAVALRDVRARAAGQVPADTDDERSLLPFLTTFMYLCYGNACSMLDLDIAAEQP
jgi:hypothetical protein